MKNDDFINQIKSLLSDDCVEKIRILDPRVKHYELYVKINNNDLKKILESYPEAKVEYTFLKKIKTIICFSGKNRFTIYNVSGVKRDKLIKMHDCVYEKMKEEDKKIMF